MCSSAANAARFFRAHDSLRLWYFGKPFDATYFFEPPSLHLRPLLPFPGGRGTRRGASKKTLHAFPKSKNPSNIPRGGWSAARGVRASLERRYTAAESRTGAHRRASAASVKVITAAVAFGAHILSTFSEFLLRDATRRAREGSGVIS